MYYDQLLALSELGHEVYLWHFASATARERFNKFVESEPETWRAVQDHCKSVNVSDYRNGENLWNRGLGKVRVLFPPRVPVGRWSVYQEFKLLLNRIRPQLVWAQHFESAALAVQQARVPVVYVHHDWLYRIKALRSHRPINPKQKAIEERLVRSVSAVVSGSKIECEEINAAGCPNVHYIPVSFEPVPLNANGNQNRIPHLVHLGGMGTTANREGLLAFFVRVWPALIGLGIRFDVIGETSSAPPALRQHLTTVNCTGFVHDLAAVLQPFHIQIIPWEYATGQRTRLPMAFNHGQVVVATKAAVACYPEAHDGENCRLVDRLEDMATIIPELLRDTAERVRLGLAAKATFESCFTRKALISRYADILTSFDQR